jgi:membrane fusion protein, multidrug efflux system
VPEDKVSQIKALAAQPGRFKARLWGSDDSLPVHIREIAAAADPVTRTFAVKADLGKTPEAAAVRLGQTATIVADLPKMAGISKLPLSALREEQGRTAVWVVDRTTMTVASKDVQIAGADGNDVVVTGGLAPGQMIVTAGVHVLNPGQQVKLYVDPAAPPVAAVATSTPVSVK